MKILLGLAVAGLMLAAGAACGDSKSTPATATATTAARGATPTSPSPSTSTAGVGTATRSAAVATPTSGAGDFKTAPAVTRRDVPAASAQVILKDVRVGQNAGYDRIVFEFQGSQLPGYEVKWVQSAIQCASGKPVYTDGQAQLQVTLRPAAAHDDRGNLTVPATEVKAGLAAIKEAKSSCDFEGVVTWVVGTKDSGYRVTELQNPTRLAIDIRQ